MNAVSTDAVSTDAASNRVFVWLADTASASQRHVELLDGTELARRDRLAMRADRDRFTLAAALLRTRAANALGVEARDVSVERTCDGCGGPHGKPSLPGTGLFVSVSHSAGVVAVAMTTAAPIGVDVEECAPRDTAGLARSVLAPGERARTAREFYTYWCRKEAVVKATGAGLRTPLPLVTVSAPAAPAALIEYRDARPPCWMADLESPAIDDGYAGAVAVLTGATLELLVFRAPAELGHPPALTSAV